MSNGLTASVGGPSSDNTIGRLSHVLAPCADPLEGARILLVEDEFLVAAMLEEMLQNLGCEVVGVAPSVARALEIVAQQPLDAAVLDVNLRGEMVFPVAEALDAAKVPFLFSTAYGPAGIPPQFGAVPILEKPYPEWTLETALRKRLAPVADEPKG